MAIPTVSTGIMELFTKAGLKMFVDWLRDLTINDGRPRHIADADAQADMVYYSTTAGKMVYKDSSGIVHNLY